MDVWQKYLLPHWTWVLWAAPTYCLWRIGSKLDELETHLRELARKNRP